VNESSLYYGWKLEKVGQKHPVQVTIPRTYVIKREKEVNTRKELHESIKHINSKLDHKKCCFPELAKHLLAASLIMTPKLSGARAELIVHATARSLLDTLNLPYTEDNIFNIMPCKKTMEGSTSRILFVQFCSFAQCDLTKNVVLVLTLLLTRLMRR
jgi:hypothetical protein